MLLKAVQILLLSTVAFAKEPPTISWYFTSISPNLAQPIANIVDEHHALFLLYKTELTDYQHTVTIAPISRIEAELKDKKLACFPGSSEAEHRKSFSYLTPQYIQPAPHLVTRKDIAKRLIKKFPKGVSLVQVLKDTELKGLIAKNRSFGTSIDAIISKSNGNLKVEFFETFEPGIFNLVEKKRVDYTIEYPFVLHNLQENKKVGMDLESIPIIDIKSTITQYLACSKTPEGKLVVERLDRKIRAQVGDPKYWEGVLNSMPKSSRKSFQKEIDVFTLNRSQKQMIFE